MANAFGSSVGEHPAPLLLTFHAVNQNLWARCWQPCHGCERPLALSFCRCQGAHDEASNPDSSSLRVWRRSAAGGLKGGHAVAAYQSWSASMPVARPSSHLCCTTRLMRAHLCHLAGLWRDGHDSRQDCGSERLQEQARPLHVSLAAALVVPAGVHSAWLDNVATFIALPSLPTPRVTPDLPAGTACCAPCLPPASGCWWPPSLSCPSPPPTPSPAPSSACP